MRSSLFNAIIALLLTASVGDANQHRTSRQTSPSFGFGVVGDAYDPATEKCCGGKAFADPGRHTYRRCCGMKLFDSSREVCCRGHAYPLAPGHVCCGTNYIDVSEEICCLAGNVLPIPKDGDLQDGNDVRKNLECCGNSTYNTETQLCCYGNAVVDKLYKNTGCCGDNPYNMDDELCCAADYTILSNASRSSACCGAVAYEPETEVCCTGNTVAKRTTPFSFACCGNTTFDVNTQSCCDGELFNKFDGNKACCRDTIYDSKTHLCCQGKRGALELVKRNGPRDICCSGHPYNPNTEFCCAGKPHDRDGASDCCGNVIYDTDRQTCCDHVNGRVLDKSGVHDRECCGNVTYDPTTHLCCNGTPIAKQDKEENRCCGINPYNSATHFCCFDASSLTGNVFPHDPLGLTSCCGGSTLRARREGCCGGRVYDARHQDCCGSKDIYKLDEAFCCRNTLVHQSPSNATSGCCGAKPYDMEKEICCMGSEVRTKSHPEQTDCCLTTMTDTFCTDPIVYPPYDPRPRDFYLTARELPFGSP